MDNGNIALKSYPILKRLRDVIYNYISIKLRFKKIEKNREVLLENEKERES